MCIYQTVRGSSFRRSVSEIGDRRHTRTHTLVRRAETEEHHTGRKNLLRLFPSRKKHHNTATESAPISPARPLFILSACVYGCVPSLQLFWESVYDAPFGIPYHVWGGASINQPGLVGSHTGGRFKVRLSHCFSLTLSHRRGTYFFLE